MSNTDSISIFCAKNGLISGPLFTHDIQDATPAVDLVAGVIALADKGVVGAFELAASIVTLPGTGASVEVRRENLLTEALALDFVQKQLGGRIEKIESKQTPIPSPYAWKPKKSCDFLAEIKGSREFFEVKDFSVDSISGHSTTVSHPHYTPATDSRKREWVEAKIQDALEKGATWLILRVNTWQPVGTKDPIEKFMKEVIRPYIDLGPNKVRIQLRKPAPSWFKGVYLVRRIGHVLVLPT